MVLKAGVLAIVAAAIGLLELHVAQRNAGEHERGGGKLGVYRQRLARQALGFVEVARQVHFVAKLQSG